MSHVLAIAQQLSIVADDYLQRHEDADLNDVLSALASMLVANCKDYEVSREELVRNIELTFDNIDMRLNS